MNLSKLSERQRNICYQFFLDQGKRCWESVGLLVGFPVVSSDLTVMCKRYLNPKWSAGGCKWEWEVLAALKLP